MSNWLRYEKAMANKAYIAIIEECVNLLTTRGSFSKEEVVEKTGYGGMEDDLRWDYVKRHIEESYKTELISLGAAYFRRHSKADEISIPAKYIAIGHAKRTCGFAIASHENGHLLRKRLEVKVKRANGAIKSRDKTQLLGQSLGVLLNQEPTPQIEHKDTTGDNDGHLTNHEESKSHESKSGQNGA